MFIPVSRMLICKGPVDARNDLGNDFVPKRKPLSETMMSIFVRLILLVHNELARRPHKTEYYRYYRCLLEYESIWE